MKHKYTFRILPALCVLGMLIPGTAGNRGGMDHMTAEAGAQALAAAPIQGSRNYQERAMAPEDYENIAISQVSDYVNIRQEPNTSSAIVGKIYNNCAANILETVEGEGGAWYRIQSGTVSGYIKAQYFITGAQADAIAKEIGIECATINTAALRLRAEPNLSSDTLTMLVQGAEYVVLEEVDNFAKLSVDEDMVGYVSMDYIKTRVEFKQAVSLEEEAAQKAEEARRVQEAQEAMQKLEEVKMVEAKEEQTQSGSQGQNSQTSAAELETVGTIPANPLGEGDDPRVSAPGRQETTAAVSPAPETEASTAGVSYGPGGNASTAVVSATRTAIVAYAKQFLGNPYVYGGSSLTEGTDCSGFVMRIFEHFGIDTGRSSRDQAVNGREIAIDAVEPGDLLFYASGDYINHVAIYIGGGQVIHAASSKTGIIISPANYRTPYKAATFLD